MGGKPFHIQGNFIIDNRTGNILKSYKEGGFLPKHQNIGSVKFPGRGYTLEEIKVAGLNRNMFKNPISGDITFKQLPYTSLHPQAFQFNVGNKKFNLLQNDWRNSLAELYKDKDFPDVGFSDYMGHTMPGIVTGKLFLQSF